MATTTKKCTHDHTEQGEHYGFTAPVNVEPYTEENRAAHGSISYTETCTHCGAQRKVNQNQMAVEVGPWGPDRETRQRRERERQARETREREEAEDLVLWAAGLRVTDYLPPSDNRHGQILVECREDKSRVLPWGGHEWIPEWEVAEAGKHDDETGAVYRAILRRAHALPITA